MKSIPRRSRRRFLAASAASLGGLNLLTPRKAAAATGNGAVLGEGEHRYEVLQIQNSKNSKGQNSKGQPNSPKIRS